MSIFELPPLDPVELASIRAENATSKSFELLEADELMLRELDEAQVCLVLWTGHIL